MSTPVITIFVRHSPGCKYSGDEFCKRCNCRKHLRWTQGGVQHRRKAGTRSWEEAEKFKRRLEDQLAGHPPSTPESAQTLSAAVTVFLKDKAAQGVTAHVLGMYTRELARLEMYCTQQGVFTVQAALTVATLTNFRSTWPAFYPSSYTRKLTQDRLRNFVKYCYNAQWITHVPKLSAIKIDAPETAPLTEAEYVRILCAVPKTFSRETTALKIHAIIQLMRHSGLAVRDASTLRRDDLQFDKSKGLWRIVSKRAKTKTPLYIPLPTDISDEMLKVMNGNPEYIFWEARGTAARHASRVGEDIKAVFEKAGVSSDGHMVSHRLRATYAVDLLQKGVPLEYVSKLLGHTSVLTTERHYAKWVKGRQDRLDSLVMGTWGEKSLQRRTR